MKIKSHFLIIAFTSYCFLVNTNARSQTERKQTFPVSVSVTNHSWAFPFQEIFRMSPIYPGVSVETKLYYKKKERFNLYQTGQLGGFLNQSAGSGIYINSNIGINYTTHYGLTADASVGLGFFNSFYPSTTYKQNEAGTYDKTNQTAIGAMSANISFGIGYDFQKKYDKHFALFMRYQWIASTNYWSLITIRPNGLLHLGATFFPFQNNTSKK